MNSLTGKKQHPWQGELQKMDEERHNKENAAMISRRKNNPNLPPHNEHGTPPQEQAAPAIQIRPKPRGESVRIIDYANINRNSSGGVGGNGSSSNRHHRRRPRVGMIFRSGGSTSSAMDEESNLDSLELTLQETSKTNTSSSQSTNTTSSSRSSPQRSPQRRRTPPRGTAARTTVTARYGGNTTPNNGDVFEDELAYIHEQSESPRTRSPKYGKLMMEGSLPTSSNPFSPYGSSSHSREENSLSPYGSYNNPPPTTTTSSYNTSSQVPSISRSGGFSANSSSLVGASRVSLSTPSSNPFDDLEAEDNSSKSQPDNYADNFHNMNNHYYKRNQRTPSTSNRESSDSEQQFVQNRLGLHQLCQEAISQDDIAWRNALYLLGMQPELAQEIDPQGRTPLHVACSGNITSKDNVPPCPPPNYIIHALLIANPMAIQQTDSDSRLPIHYMASTSGDNDSFQLLVEAHPASIAARDSMGWTPLHLFLQNPHIIITVPPIQVLLGMTLPIPPIQRQHESAQDDDPMLIRQRRGDHLRLNVEHLDRMRQTTRASSSEQHLLSSRGPRWRPLQRYDIPEEIVNGYPEDVRVCLRRLAQWERKQQRLTQQKEEEEHKEQQKKNKDSSFLSSFTSSTTLSSGAFQEQERNPAALAAPQGQALPLHMIILRGLVDVHLQSSRIPEPPKRRKSKEKHKHHDPNGLQQRQQHTLIVIVRILISAYPEGLIARDVNGHTPLLLAMVTAADVLPSQELLELLLGKRTAGYESLPMWAQDVPYPIQHAYTPPSRRRLAPAAERYCNPAIVSTLDTCQLPLHIAAEEWGDHSSLIVAIYESYPGAIHVQDARGRMPLHILLHNYRQLTPHPEIVAMLLSERVASTTNDEGQLPFDLLVAAAPFLPKDPIPCSVLPGGIVVHPEPYRAFQQLFQPSILPSSVAPGSNGGRGQTTTLRRRAEAEVFLWRLRSLPPWLRRQACRASFVQELLLEELASPSKCAFVMAQGFVLALLVAAFRQLMDLFIETSLHNNISTSFASNSFQFFAGEGEEILNSNIVVEPSLRYKDWIILAIYGLGAISIGFQAVVWALSGSLNEFQHLCLFNIWRWVDIVAILSAVATAVLIHEGVSDEQVLIVASVATGILWCSVVGFLSQWWYGMAFFTGSIVKLVQTMLWPALLAAISLVGFAEMFYMIAQVDCSTALGPNSICSLRDSYQLAYFLLVGEPVVELGSQEPPSIGMTVLLVLFAALSFLLLLGTLVVIVVVASKCDHSETVALDAYWEPKLALVISSQSSRSAAERYKKDMWIPQSSRMDRFVAQLDETWGVSACLLFGVGKQQYWYATSLPTLKKMCLRAFLVIVLPIWLIAGLFTFGALWPPQVRRFLFRPRLNFPGDVKRNETREFFAAQVAGVRNEVVKLKGMSYEQSNDVYQEIQQLKAMIAALSAD